MNINPNIFRSLQILKDKFQNDTSNNDDHIGIQDLRNLKNSTSTDVSQDVKTAAIEVLKDRRLVRLLDNGLSGASGLRDNYFKLDDLNSVLFSLDPTNPKRTDLEALKLVKKTLISQGNGPWDVGSITALTQNAEESTVKNAATRVLDYNQQVQFLKGSFGVDELDAAIAQLDPLNPKTQNLDALKTIADLAETYPNQEISTEKLTEIANDSRSDESLKIAAKRLLNNKGLLKLAETGGPQNTNSTTVTYKAWQLKAAMEDLNPLNSRNLDISALRNLATYVRTHAEYTGKAINYEQLTTLAGNSEVDASLRAAAKRILNNEKILELVDNVFARPNSQSSDGTAEPLNNKQYQAAAFDAVANALNPLSASSRYTDILETLKSTLSNAKNELTYTDLINLQESDTSSPSQKQAATRLLNDADLMRALSNDYDQSNQIENLRFGITDIEAIKAKFEQSSPSMQDVRALQTIANEAAKYDPQEISMATLNNLAEGPDDPVDMARYSLKAAANHLLNDPALLKLASADSSDATLKTFKTSELRAAIADINPLKPKMQDVEALSTLASYIKTTYPNGIKIEQLKTLADNSEVDSSTRAAAARISGNEELLKLAENALTVNQENGTFQSLNAPLNDNTIHSQELEALASYLHPLSENSKSLDALQTIKNEILSKPTIYTDNEITDKQLRGLQATGTPALKQAANRLLNTPIWDLLRNNGLSLSSGPSGVYVPRANIGRLDMVMSDLSPSSATSLITSGLKLLQAEITGEHQGDYPNQTITKQQFTELLQNGSPEMRLALTAMINNEPLLFPGDDTATEPLASIKSKLTLFDLFGGGFSRRAVELLVQEFRTGHYSYKTPQDYQQSLETIRNKTSSPAIRRAIDCLKYNNIGWSKISNELKRRPAQS